MVHKISVNAEVCIGCGACVATCPGSFEMKNGKSRPKKTTVAKLTCEEDAAEGCPVGAISIK